MYKKSLSFNAVLIHFQVFFSSYIFSTNVMVKVATRPAENPVCWICVMLITTEVSFFKVRNITILKITPI